MIQKEFGLQGNLQELMESMSHREYLTRLAWIEDNYNDPNRTDFYLMQIATEIRRVLHKHPKQVKINQFKLPFGKKKEQKWSTMEESKAAWFGALNALKKQQND